MNPVPVPLVREGDDALEALAVSRSTLAQANYNLKCSKTWYAGVRKSYSK